MAERIVVDPITRIEGHLRAEVEISDGTIKEAFLSSTMVRGLENIVKDRNPKDVWAFVQRTCGVCTSTHATASVRAVEDALGIVVPPNAEIVRNIMLGALYLHDHVVHFYHLHAFDWVDVLSGLNADPVKTSQLAQSISNWPKSSPGYFSDLQKRLKKFVASGQLGIFANGYWGHPQMKLPPEANLMATAHYLEALEWQKEIVKVHAIFGGKNPHPNFLVGGMACSINLDDASGLNAERLAFVRQLLEEGKRFVEQVYLPDVLAIAGYYKDWGAIGGFHNFMTFGDFPTQGHNNTNNDTFKFPAGVILNKDLTKVHDLDLRDLKTVEEYVNNSWYDYEGDGNSGRQPWSGETKINYTGPKPPYTHLNVDEKYSFIKTPRWKGHAMEVGPLARMLVGYASGREEFKDIVDGALSKLQIPAAALFSTLGRTAARALESQLVANWNLEFFDDLIKNIKNGDTKMANMEKWETNTWPKESQGVGLVEAPRGALSHWIVIKDAKVANYQQVVPSTWNASPKDPKGQRSPYESTLLNTPIANPELPLEIIRTIHSFDPCIACAVHLYDENGDIIKEVNDITICTV
ncbi:nickel-dependent hydrogenase large subunit [Flavobacterium johnsoniae]|uniref:Nickel-dependent hydrogenase, large subunit n=1 Tax=Flavobacterium johnsoniae (strain ATCC 17061 / DSM 2064 / JCM 8514 / BCRC 14874 / CCUG 350202 / NBRC 14942 / NCIMB 11054 / UW101) TaxID=376686 RepID=A5FD05_FLAJ1|nr:nickel-dependent hydrogenase large subunit [Flavobacterium johnsoniae]ABQ06918.1 nickel-dependent hydrogenase, large subunit [Flavobacterium johnsoniae UW101]OXE97224.1 hydrogenase 2 large subunit [Flavobacterium johnsoniae UW101]WQG81249.1 nickel-dependent hydrogenase large subunit [Flavobacterium johnsoniae UW101]SHL36623.1 hydrogenase large subunit [Flavobacterium johnsoniae]